MTRSFNFDGIDVEGALQGGAGETLPGGEYIVQITDIKDRADGFARQGKHAGWPAVDLVLKVVESGTGVGVGQSVRHFNLGIFPKFDSGKANFTFIQFFTALGVELKGQVELPTNEEILGQKVGVVLGFTDERNGKIYNEVTRFFPPEDGVNEGSTPVPAVSGGGSAPAPAGGGGDTSQPWAV